MAVSPRDFPAKKRHPPDVDLLVTLLLVAREISAAKPVGFAPQRRNAAAVVRKVECVAVLFEELLSAVVGRRPLPCCAPICLAEILLVMQRIKALVEGLSSRSKFWLLVQSEEIANTFQEAEVDLATLLDILPVPELHLPDDVVDQVSLVKNQCRRSRITVDPAGRALRAEVLNVIAEIESDIVPDRSRLARIFRELGILDSRACRNELKALESETAAEAGDKSAAIASAVAGLVLYAKCVLYSGSTPRSATRSHSVSASDIPVPADFRCPISLELMRDPVVVATGQTYDRASISRWIESGHATCPKTGQPLLHSDLTPNRALKNLIARWCREMRVPYDAPERSAGESVVVNRAARKATRMTAVFLTERLRESPDPEAANRVVHELRGLAKLDSENRALIAEAGAVELLVPLLGSDAPSLQTNAVTALLNLSILDANKNRIMAAKGGLDGVVRVLEWGGTWEARENAAAMLLSLSTVHAFRRRILREPRVIRGLVELVKSGPPSSQRDALAAILNLAADRESVGMLVKGDAVAAALAAASSSSSDAAEEAVTVVAALAKRGGATAVGSTSGAVATLVGILSSGTERAREYAAAALVSICRRRSTAALELAATPRIERLLLELMGSGTPRGRMKAAALLQISNRWAIAA